MVVIDAAKHKLDYKTSAADNGIDSLKKKYQDGGGVSTLISRAASEVDIPKRKLRSAAKGGPIDPLTGRKVYEDTGESYTVVKEYKTKAPRMETYSVPKRYPAWSWLTTRVSFHQVHPWKNYTQATPTI